MILRVLLRLCDHIFVLRPLIMTPAWSFFLLGAAVGHARGSGRIADAPRPAIPDLVPLCALTAILASAYLLNQIFDRETDRMNKKVFFLADGLFTVKNLVIMSLGYFLLASFLFHRSDPVHQQPLILALLLSLTYSLPPFRFCSRPFLDLLANAVGFGGVAFVLGFTTFEPSLPSAALLSLPYIMLVGGTFLFTTLLDIEGDRNTGKMTTGVCIGERNAERGACLLIAGALVSALLLRHHPAALISAAALFPCLFATVKRTGAARSLFVQAVTLLVILGAAAAWPLYAAVIVPLLLLAKWYYGRRFGINYPGVRRDA